MQTEAGASLIPPDPDDHPTAEPADGPAVTPTADRTVLTARRHRLFAILALVAVLVYAADQVTKAWAMSALTPDVTRPFLGQVLQLRLIQNAGAAFSIGTNATWLLTLVACVVVGVIIVTSRRLGSVGWAFALGLLLGGSLGNLTDRMVRAPGVGRGHVVDFLQLPHWPIFNLADSSIVSAAILIGILAVRGTGVDGTKAGSGTGSRAGSGSGPAAATDHG